MNRRYVFLGGCGRSGTSYLTNMLSGSESIFSIKDVELKFFGELHGLPDLHSALVSNFGLFRAKRALGEFRAVFRSLFEEAYANQLNMLEHLDWEVAESIVDEYLLLLSNNCLDYPFEVEPERFQVLTRQFVDRFFDEMIGAEDTRVRLEKTPHNLLNATLLESVFPGSRYIHVARDPRAVVLSLQKMTWGPSTIKDGLRWYQTYFHAWSRELMRLDLQGVDVFRMRIEDLHFSPEATLQRLNDYLSLEHPVELKDFEFATLVAARSKIDSADFQYLTAQLRHEIEADGYDPAELGALA